MEPMARALRQSKEVGAIQVRSIQKSLALNADDLLLFLPSLQATLQILNKFSFSGLRGNWGKSSILPLGLGAQRAEGDNLPLQWVSAIT